nr:unnamed protein product [Digitaria exilis]
MNINDIFTGPFCKGISYGTLQFRKKVVLQRIAHFEELDALADNRSRVPQNRDEKKRDVWLQIRLKEKSLGILAVLAAGYAYHQRANDATLATRCPRSPHAAARHRTPTRPQPVLLAVICTQGLLPEHGFLLVYGGRRQMGPSSPAREDLEGGSGMRGLPPAGGQGRGGSGGAIPLQAAP